MKTVFLFVDKPTFIGDILKTNYIKYLATKYKVVIFTRSIDDKTARTDGYFLSPNVKYIKWQIENGKFLGWMKFVRFSCIREFDHLATTKHFRNRRGKKGEKTFLRILSRPFAPILTSRFFYRLERLLLKDSKKFAYYFKKYNPVLLIMATPGLNTFEAEAIMLAKSYNLKSVSVGCAWDNLTTRATRVRPTDYFIAWHEPMRQEAIIIHKQDPQKTFVAGPMRFDYYFFNAPHSPSREEFLRSKNLDPKNKTILYTTQKAHFFEEQFLTDLIALRHEKKIPFTNIFIRTHPLVAPNRFGEFSDIENVYVERPARVMANEDLLNLKYSLMHTDLNINYSSTISLEAALFDKPIINYYEPTLKSFELNHYKPLVDARAVRLIKTKSELIAAIKEYLANPSLDNEKRKKIADIYFPFRDDLAYKRNVDFLEKIIVK